MSGPLSTLRVLELAGIGPAPFCGMMLADFGAEVIRIDRPVGRRGLSDGLGRDALNRGKRSIVIDVKEPRGLAVALQLVDHADVLIEGYRPGVMERLGLGPDVCLTRNPKLVYGRVTGFGQDGPLAPRAGHDINYIALSGALGAIGPQERPAIPLNLIGDFGGGGMLLALGVVAAVLNAQRTGKGQVVDAAMVDGAALLMTSIYALRGAGLWSEQRQASLLDGGAPMYNVYATKDGAFVSVGPLEPQFYAQLIDKLGIAADDQLDPDNWPVLTARFADVFKTRTRSEWESIFADSDACVVPVLSLAEAPHHPHNVARQTFTTLGGVIQPSPAPKFSATPAAIAHPPPTPGCDTRAILAELGVSDIAALFAANVVGD